MKAFSAENSLQFVWFLLPLGAICMPAVGGPQPEPDQPILLLTLPGWSNGLASGPDGKTLAYCGNFLRGDGINLYRSRGIIKSSFMEDGKVVAFSPAGKLLVSGGNEGSIKVWGVETGKCLDSVRPSFGPFFGLASARTESNLRQRLAT